MKYKVSSRWDLNSKEFRTNLAKQAPHDILWVVQTIIQTLRSSIVSNLSTSLEILCGFVLVNAVNFSVCLSSYFIGLERMNSKVDLGEI